MKYIFRSSIDIDHKDWKPGRRGRVPLEWVEHRLKLFHDYTLKSLLNQTEQDFEIWVFCGQCYKATTSAYNWHPRVKVIYGVEEFFRNFLSIFNEEYITIARIDSDDLYHKNAFKVIKENLVKNKNKDTKMAFCTMYSWHRINNIIKRYHQRHPPCFVHTFPKKLYKDFNYFKKVHLSKHVGASHDSKELPEYHFCETIHDQSWTRQKRHGWSKSYVEKVVSEELKLDYLKHKKLLAIDKEGLYNILKDFGVKKDLI